MAKAKGSSIAIQILGGLIVLYVAVRYLLPGITGGVRTLAGSMAGTAGSLGYGQTSGLLPVSANYRSKNGTVSSSFDAGALIKALMGRNRGPSMGMSPTHATGGGSDAQINRAANSVKGNFGNNQPISIADLLSSGAAGDGTMQNTLAGIYNVQNGYAFDGETTDALGQSFYDSGYSTPNGSMDAGNTSLDYAPTENFDLSQVSAPITSPDTSSADTSSGDNVYFIDPTQYDGGSYDGGGYSLGFE